MLNLPAPFWLGIGNQLFRRSMNSLRGQFRQRVVDREISHLYSLRVNVLVKTQNNTFQSRQ